MPMMTTTTMLYLTQRAMRAMARSKMAMMIPGSWYLANVAGWCLFENCSGFNNIIATLCAVDLMIWPWWANGSAAHERTNALANLQITFCMVRACERLSWRNYGERYHCLYHETIQMPFSCTTRAYAWMEDAVLCCVTCSPEPMAMLSS